MSVLDKQEGGNHYKDLAIQPVEYIVKNELGYLEGNVIKYVTRHHKKKGAEDIRKAIHYLQMILELQYPTTESDIRDKAMQTRGMEILDKAHEKIRQTAAYNTYTFGGNQHD